MSVREVRDCDRCGVTDISKRTIGLGSEEEADLCAECAHKVLEAVGPHLIWDAVNRARKCIDDPKAKTEYNPC